MNNYFLRERNARQIDRAIEKVLQELGYPEPPLDLSIVRRNLRIDLEYYRSTDQHMLREVVHSAKMGGATLFENVMELGRAIRKWDLRALFIPSDRKRILLDSDPKNHPKAKWRWSEAHEIAHSLITWHGPLMAVDTMATLSPACLFDMEMEANFGAGRLLFLQGRFTDEARSVEPTFQNIITLAKRYNNTKASTLWRYVEAMDVPAFGIVGFHPTHHTPPEDVDGPCRYFIRSEKFIAQFATFIDSDAVAIFESYCNRARGGPLGKTDAVITDDNGDEHIFHFESFNNTYDALTLATHVRKKSRILSVPA